MAYTRTQWKPEDLVTAVKMNNIEQFIETLDNTNDTLNDSISANKASIDLINNKIGENNGTIGTINERIKTNTDNIETNTNDIQEINNEIISLHNKDTNITDQINGIMAIDDNLNQQIEILKSEGVTGYKGQYDENTTYKLGDMVSYENKFYVCISNESSNQTPINNTNYWQEMSEVASWPVIELGSNEPTNPNVKLWINTNTSDIMIPTVDDFSVVGHTFILNLGG